MVTETPSKIQKMGVTVENGRISFSPPPGVHVSGVIYQDAISGLRHMIPMEGGHLLTPVPFHGPDKPLKLINRHTKDQDGWRGAPEREEPVDGVDPTVIGFDGRLYQGVSSMQYQTNALVFAAAGTPSIQLPRNTFITELMIVADPFQTQGDGSNTATIVEDAQDKLLQGLSVAGGPTYYSHQDAILYAKALGNLNKVVYGGSMVRQDIGTSSSASNLSNYESWRMHFGALNDHMPFDITSGIPAEDETALNFSVLFSGTSVFAATSTHKVVQTGTNVWVVVIGVNGMPAAYRANCPIPDFRTDIIAAPTTTTTINLLGSRFLKRSIIVSQAAAASNNNARNDSNITDLSISILKPTSIKLLDRARWNVAKALASSWGGRYPSVDANGTIAVNGNGLTGVVVIDWRKITGNPYGIDTYSFQTSDLSYVLTMGTTTGQISALHEYYAARNEQSLAFMRAWQNRFAFQPV